MDHEIIYDIILEEQIEDYAKKENSTAQYVDARREIHKKLEKMNTNVSSLIKHGTDGIFNKIKDLLNEVKVKKTDTKNYSVAHLPTHESVKQNEDAEEDFEEEDNAPQLPETAKIAISDKTENSEKKIKHFTPFFTVINADDSGDTKYKEMCRNSLNRKKNVSLDALEKKIEKRNDFLKKFGKTYNITNLT